MKFPNKVLFLTIALVISIVAIGLMATGFTKVQAAALPIRVPANVEWVNTGIAVQEGDSLQIKSEGVAITAAVNEWGQGTISNSAGQWWNLGCGQYVGAPPPCALAGEFYGMLVGKVGDVAFPIGDSETIIAPADGFLYFSVNDNIGFYTDNLGGYTVVIK